MQQSSSWLSVARLLINTKVFFAEAEGSLPCSQQATGHYPGSSHCSADLQTPLSYIRHYLSTRNSCKGLFAAGIANKILSMFSPPNKCYIWTHFIISFFPPVAQQPLVGQTLHIIEASRPHSDTPHSVGLLWTSDQPEPETSTWQHTTLTTDRYPRPPVGFEPTIPASERP
jgi:hypothetical protein